MIREIPNKKNAAGLAKHAAFNIMFYMGFDISIWQAACERKLREREEVRKKFLKAAARKIKKYFDGKKVKGVYITGSLLKENAFYDFSDVDIAVEGLAENPLTVLTELEDLLERDVDLIEIEKCCFKDFIYSHGRKIE